MSSEDPVRLPPEIYKFMGEVTAQLKGIHEQNRSHYESMNLRIEDLKESLQTRIDDLDKDVRDIRGDVVIMQTSERKQKVIAAGAGGAAGGLASVAARLVEALISGVG